jgi:type I pantothenate kinase
LTRLEELERILAARRGTSGRGTFVIGITGGVAAGKSTLAAELADRMAVWPPGLAVEIIGTDGFLRDNATLEAAGLTLRKGCPETYDTAALAAAIVAVRSGRANFPGYSHSRYDIDPALTRTLHRPDILIVEGLGLGGAPVDVLVYVDAAEADLEVWYVARFMALWDAGRADAASFYARFAAMTPEQAEAFAHQVWRGINLPNVREHIAPLRRIAGIVVEKSSGHAIHRVTER